MSRDVMLCRHGAGNPAFSSDKYSLIFYSQRFRRLSYDQRLSLHVLEGNQRAGATPALHHLIRAKELSFEKLNPDFRRFWA